MAAQTTKKQINKALAAAGFEEVEIAWNPGYYGYWYFYGGEAYMWRETAILMTNLDSGVEAFITDAQDKREANADA